MSQGSGQPAARAADDAARRKRTERTLIFIVVLLGLLMVAGIVAVVLRVIYLSSQPAAQPASTAAGTQGAQGEAVSLALPPGGVVKSVSLAGDRIAVHYEAAGRAGIAVVDLTTGAVVRRVDVVPADARP